MTIYRLWIESVMCVGINVCGKCNKILPGFTEMEDGLFISKLAEDAEETKAAAQFVRDSCPFDAIKFR